MPRPTVNVLVTAKTCSQYLFRSSKGPFHAMLAFDFGMGVTQQHYRRSPDKDVACGICLYRSGPLISTLRLANLFYPTGLLGHFIQQTLRVLETLLWIMPELLSLLMAPASRATRMPGSKDVRWATTLRMLSMRQGPKMCNTQLLLPRNGTCGSISRTQDIVAREGQYHTQIDLRAGRDQVINLNI